ncbi:MAG: ABC transporter ATP-binding protein [Candidatus Omnitrophica bacterium]|nr:ABC transporter ATP-binding protein [Candidatus Omnitrophota bacterium]
MSDTVIIAEEVSKKFSKNIRETLVYGVGDVSRNIMGMSAAPGDIRKGEFWAVDKIAFELKKGRTLGVIGPNGSGKTTLLKLINGIFMPDRGRIKVRGKVGAMIQVGAGFHPMLTGRENIYVNGAILGMSRKEISRKFDSIVEFADIGDFLDAPVRHYSSGMYIRLGFAIAIHCEPDILLMDEILAVGDIGFVSKCFRKFRELREKGISWVLVSHDMGTIKCYCDEVLYMDGGKSISYGDPDKAISSYLLDMSRKKADISRVRTMREFTPSEEGRIVDIAFLDSRGLEKESFFTGEELTIKIEYIANERIESPVFGVAIYGSDGQMQTGSNTKISGFSTESIHGPGSVLFKMKNLPLQPGVYRVRADMSDSNVGIIDMLLEQKDLRVEGGNSGVGAFYTPHEWVLIPGGNG